MSAIARTFVIRDAIQAKLMLAFIKNNAAEMAQMGRPLEVRVYEHKAKRTNPQNALMWTRLQELAEQAWIGGRRYEAETWNEQMKRDLLPDETSRGVPKWKYLPNGERELFMSTTDLDVSEMTTYLDKLAAAGAELGVTFSA